MTPLIADIIRYEDHLHVPVVGTFELDAATRILERIIEACRLSGITRVVLDTRGMKGSISATERVLFGLAIAEPYRQYLDSGSQPIQIAIFSTSRRLSPYHPLSESLSNQGLPTRAFVNPAEVTEWLSITALGNDWTGTNRAGQRGSST